MGKLFVHCHYFIIFNSKLWVITRGYRSYKPIPLKMDISSINHSNTVIFKQDIKHGSTWDLVGWSQSQDDFRNTDGWNHREWWDDDEIFGRQPGTGTIRYIDNSRSCLNEHFGIESFAIHDTNWYSWIMHRWCGKRNAIPSQSPACVNLWTVYRPSNFGYNLCLY